MVSSVLRGVLGCSMEQGRIRAGRRGSIVQMLQLGSCDRISCGGSVSGMLSDPHMIGPSGSRLTLGEGVANERISSRSDVKGQIDLYGFSYSLV